MQQSSFNPAEFDWYWQPRFSDRDSKDYFDREHWWIEDASQVSAHAKWYELLRRHPATGRLLSLPNAEQNRFLREGGLQRFLILYARGSWSQLTGGRGYFAEGLKEWKFGKGRDVRPAINNLCENAQTTSTSSFTRKANAVWSEHPELTRTEAGREEARWEASRRLIQDLALREFDNGKLIVSIRLDVADLAGLVDEVKQVYEHWRKTTRLPKVKAGRDSTETWLRIIATFEQSERERLFDTNGRPRQKPAARKTNQSNRYAFQKLFRGISF